MKVFILMLVLMPITGQAQDEVVPLSREDYLERIAEDTEDDEDAEGDRLLILKRSKIDLNNCSVPDLEELPMLTAIHIGALRKYLEMAGPLVSIYELQAIPGWDLDLIRSVLPFVTLGGSGSLRFPLSQQLAGGEFRALLRWGRILETQKGFLAGDSGRPAFAGSADRAMARISYNFRGLLMYGITFDKDAGERMFDPVSRMPEHIGFHFYAKDIWKFTSVAIGDFTVNLGQGLVHWQGGSFSKSSAVLAVRRQGIRVRPFRSAAEANFHRGFALEKHAGRWNVMAFASQRKMDANFNESGEVSSILTSGLHRTVAELNAKKRLGVASLGSSVQYRWPSGHIAVNHVSIFTSHPINRRNLPYNHFSLRGTRWTNSSVDFAYTYRNSHFFGELARDYRNGLAGIAGMLSTIDPKVDLSLLYRNLEPEYQAFYGGAFTENTSASNEKGFYAGLSIRPNPRWRADMYVDLFRFPWLRFTADAPSGGQESVIQLTYTPSRSTEMYTRFRIRHRESNSTPENAALREVIASTTYNWRVHLAHDFSKLVQFRARVEYVSTGKAESGFLGYGEAVFSRLFNGISGSIRLQTFETNGYSTRVYAYEQDLPYSFSIPPNFNTGFRYYINLRTGSIPLSRNRSADVRIAMKWAQTLYRELDSHGSGLTTVKDDKRSDIRLQAEFAW